MGDSESSKGGLRSRRALLLGAACGVSLPALRVVFHAQTTSSAGAWVRVAKLGDLVDGEPLRARVVADRTDAWTTERDVELGSVYVLRTGQEVTAFSAACPHLGCTVSANSETKGFTCKCHDSNFASDGSSLDGPSPRGLDPLEVRIEQGAILVHFRRFRSGMKDRIPVA